jgi:Protein of unknown function (DUF2510)
MAQTPAGWYPQGDGERYWDGNQWTGQTRLLTGGAPPQPPQGAFQGAQPDQPPAPKKKHTMRNVLLLVVGLMVLLVGGCFALLGAALNEADKAIDEEVKNDTPTVVTEGRAFHHDGFAVADGWKVKPEQFGGATIAGMKVTLEDDQGITSGRDALLTFRLYNGKTVVTEIECNGNRMQEGETSPMDCFSLDTKKVGNWGTIKVSDFW